MFPFYQKALLFLNIGLAWSLAVPARNLDNRAAYFLDNDPNGNFIIALKISPDDGTLSSPVRISTGGTGLAGLVAISQDSVVVSENGYLFTINSLSDTVSMFTIDNDDPWHPKLVGSPAPTLGNTPVSVAYSRSLNTACVLNSGLTAGITCYTVSRTKGLTPLGTLRPIPQPTDGPAPPGPLTIAADIVFNPSSTALFASTRSNFVVPGHIYAYAVVDGQVSTERVTSSIPGIVADFSLNFLSSDSRLLITNPIPGTPGADILHVSPSLEVTLAKPIVIPGQLAACWVAYSPHGSAAYIIDAALPNITVVDTETGNIRARFGYSAVSAGGVDVAIDRGRLYLLTDDPTAPKINVFDLHEHDTVNPATQIQSLDIFSVVGPIPFWMGMAIYPA